MAPPVPPDRASSSVRLSNGVAFVTPASSNPLLAAASRRALSRPICPLSHAPRRTLVMKKTRRAVDEGDNAVDVFAGATLSPEELLANALGEDTSSSVSADPVADAAPVKDKKKKKKKKAATSGDDNAVDVFGATDMTPEELLASALGEDTPAEEPQSGKKKKKKKKGKKAVTIDDDNAVDVFGAVEASQDNLLADALQEDPRPEKASKKKKAKKGLATEDDNAVDVFGSSDVSPDDLLASAMNGTGEVPQSNKKKGKAKGKGKPGTALDPTLEATSDDDHSVEEIVPEVAPMAPIENEELVSEEHVDVVPAKDLETEPVVASEEDTQQDPIDEEEVEEDFTPDDEIVAEFEKSSEEFAEFTALGRREKSRKKRKERNETESLLADPRRANFGSGGEKYTSVRLEDVTMTFRDTTILNGVTWGVQTGERVGLIGENGCGKTTQLRMIAGLMEPSSGEVVRSSTRTKASFLRQEFVDELDPTRTLKEEFFAAFKEEGELVAAYQKCEQDISSAGEDMEKLEEHLNRLEDLRVQCEEKDAWNLEPRVDKVMPGLGFTEEDGDKLVASFSGGWKVRIGLGKVLLQDPDLLLLDEPSNHLDNESVEWLETYLQTCKLPMIVVSHDREFLDRVCTKIVEIESGEAFEYPGNYTTFVKLKKERRTAWEAAYERQQKFVKEQTNYIKRNRRSPARVAQVKSRQKMLERMERTGQMVRRPPRQGKPLVFRFPPAPRSGRDCILVEDLSHGYGGRPLFEETSISIERGDRIALIGPNGSGKSTLLRMITGREEPQEGNVECGELTNVTLAYYEQNQADALDLEVTVLETLKESAPDDMRYEEIRALLGKFLFKGDDVEKQVEALSGGEKARLALAKIMLKPSNVLILDEPGNHLSISAKEMLEEALQNFDGTLLMVSHDRYLISQVATQIVAVEDRQLVLYDGDYKSYMEKNEALREKLQARFIPGVAEIKSAPKVEIEEPTELVEKKSKRKKSFGGSGLNSGKTKEMNAKRWNRR